MAIIKLAKFSIIHGITLYSMIIDTFEKKKEKIKGKINSKENLI